MRSRINRLEPVVRGKSCDPWEEGSQGPREAGMLGLSAQLLIASWVFPLELVVSGEIYGPRDVGPQGPREAQGLQGQAGRVGPFGPIP